jgi:phosphoribosyl-AMP cyclohydrolase
MRKNTQMNSPIPALILEQFSRGDLVAAIAQDFESNEVLMLAWMNQEALEQTLATRKGTYWSRSRNRLWVKGESSVHFLEVRSLSYDCDGDAILLKVRQIGAACHTGDRSCFHNALTAGVEL